MDSLKQYIDLYEEHEALVASKSAAVMNALRSRALTILQERGLPQKGSENYEATDISEMLSPDFGLNLSRVDLHVNAANAFKCGVPNVSTSLYLMFNDIYHETRGAQDGLPDGVYVGSLKVFCEKYPEVAARYYGAEADLANPIAALNTLFAQDGIAVWIQKGVKVEKPLQIINLLDSGMPLMAVRRVLVILEEGAEVRILSCDHTQRQNMDFLALQTVEIFAGKDSMLNVYELEESTKDTSRLSAFYVKQQEGSRVLIDGITLYNGKTRNEYYVSFEGKRAELRLYGMGILDETRHLDTYSRIDHNVGECHTDELFKYVLDDKATGAFAGLIKVMQGADGTEAYQSNRNIVGSEDAYMFSKPQLEIYDDDVKCSHGCATGQLDEQQVFYMQARGIPRDEAKFLLKQAFMADIIDAVLLPGLRERLILLVEKRFAGESLGCSTCAGCGVG